MIDIVVSDLERKHIRKHTNALCNQRGLSNIVSSILVITITIVAASLVFLFIYDGEIITEEPKKPVVLYENNAYTLVENKDNLTVGVGSDDGSPTIEREFQHVGDRITATGPVIAKHNNDLILIRDNSERIQLPFTQFTTVSVDEFVGTDIKRALYNDKPVRTAELNVRMIDNSELVFTKNGSVSFKIRHKNNGRLLYTPTTKVFGPSKNDISYKLIYKNEQLIIKRDGSTILETSQENFNRIILDNRQNNFIRASGTIEKAVIDREQPKSGILKYDFEGTGSIATDEWNSNNAELKNGFTRTNGKVQLDGNSGYIDAGLIPDMNNQPLTITAEVTPNYQSGSRDYAPVMFALRESSGDFRWTYNFGGYNNEMHLSGSNFALNNSLTASPTQGVEDRITIVLRDNSADIYLNGVRMAIFRNKNFVGSFPFRIGGWNSGPPSAGFSENHPITVDDVKAYDKELTKRQITKISQTGSI